MVHTKCCSPLPWFVGTKRPLIQMLPVFIKHKRVMDVRHHIEPHLNRGGVAIIISLDIQEAFGSPWWPAILQRLIDIKCPRNLYYLIQDYLTDRKAVMTMNNFSVEKTITKACPQGSCCGPGLWNIQYDSA